MHKGTHGKLGDLMCSCQLSATLSFSLTVTKKENIGTFYGSNDFAKALIGNVPAMCCKSGVSVVQPHVPGQSSQEPDFTVVWH